MIGFYIICLCALAIKITYGDVGDNIQASAETTNAYTTMVGHVKALRGNFAGLDIRKEMEYITYSSAKIYRTMFNEYFGGHALGYTENPPIDYLQFPDGNDEEIYVLGSGSFARYEATGTSDLDVMIIIIKPPSSFDYEGTARRQRVTAVCRQILLGSLGYSRTLETAAAISGNVATTGALHLDIAPGCHVKKTIDEFMDTVVLYEANDPQTWDYAKASQFIDSFPLYLSGNANFHTLQKAFWEKITATNMKAAYMHYRGNFYPGTYKTAYANGDEFSAKESILRPLTLPIVYFYNLAFREHGHQRYARRTTSTLERLYFMAEWGYISLDEIQAVEHTFLWGSKNQLEANLILGNDAVTQVHHGKTMTVNDGNRNGINAHVARVVQFMAHIGMQYGHFA